MTTKDRQSLLDSLNACLTVATSVNPVSDGGSDGLVFELRRLHEWLSGDAIENWTPSTAIGHLRYLFRQPSLQPLFTEPLIDTLRDIVESFPFLAKVPEMRNSSPGFYRRVGGVDPYEAVGIDPQHRSRFVALFH